MNKRYIPAELRRLVSERANNRCEYCQLSQFGQEATFHVDHVTPLVAGGKTTAENLAFACVSCSLRKSAREIATDPKTGSEAPLFNPRHDSWNDHFRWEGTDLVGLSPSGRATIHTLSMNRSIILAIREEEVALGRQPKRNATEE